MPVSTATTATTATVNANFVESRYCVEGHKGAYCSVCADGYQRFYGGQMCISCDGRWSSSARGILWVMGVAATVLLISLVAFLVGGVKAVSQASHFMLLTVSSTPN